MSNQARDTGADERGTSLSQALTFHASFDRGPDADFALGDKTLYTAHPTGGSLTPGLGNPPLTVVAGGKFGAALAFTPENTHVVVYRAEQNVAYSPAAFRGTISFWLRVDPAEIPGQYCDPLQVTDKDYSNACIWVDFTKNDMPSEFRLGVFGDRSVWDASNQASQGPAFYWRLLRVAEPPFAKDRWTHVVITWDGVNQTTGGRARLYFNGAYQGATSLIREPFSWDVSKALIRLGTGSYVGLLDDLAVFNRPLTLEEVQSLGKSQRGVAELYR